MIDDKIKNNKNLGIQILRSLLCFWVVLNHCSHINKSTKIGKILFKYRMHVPCFILMAFYFSNKIFISGKVIKIKNRFERLLIPYFILPIIVLIINNVLYSFTSISPLGRTLTIKDLFYQYIFGRCIVPVFWFQFYIIWSTLLFIIISFLSGKNFIIIIIHIFFISYFLQYSNLNYKYFSSFIHMIKYSLGSFVEMLPISASGCLMSSLNIFNLINNRVKSIYISLLCLYLILYYDVFKFINSVSFGGIALNFGSIFIFIIFYMIPLNYIKSKNIINIILAITNYTQGIYCFHMITYDILSKKINTINYGGFKGCILLYIFCYLLSYLCYKLQK